MLKVEELTEEQKSRYKKFLNFYTDDMVDTLSLLFDKYRINTQKEEYYISYQNIIRTIASLMKEIGTDNPLLACIVFEYLLWNGYLSEDKELIYSLSNRINNLIVPGAGIMRGKSVCLNNASMLADIIRKLGYEAYSLCCTIPKGFSFKGIPRPNIERKRDTEVSLSYKIASKAVSIIGMGKIGNHAVTMIKDNNLIYISDPTNLAFANFSDFLRFKYIGNDGEISAKPWLSLTSGEMPPEVFKLIFGESFLKIDEPKFNKSLIEKANTTTLELCQENTKLFDDFHDSITPDILTVSKTLKKEKNK